MNFENRAESMDLVPMLSFKPIDFDVESSNTITNCSALDQSFDSDGPGMSPMEIFRDGAAEDGEALVQKANPINERQSSSSKEDMEDSSVDMIRHENASPSRVISPYPFSHASREEIEDREQLSSSFGWTLPAVVPSSEKIAFQVDYSRFFELGEAADCEMGCDDFSLSSQEANSLSEEDCLESISEDPASFWEEGAGRVFGERSSSPSQVSLEGSSE